jgi:hypothetical protein
VHFINRPIPKPNYHPILEVDIPSLGFAAVATACREDAGKCAEAGIVKVLTAFHPTIGAFPAFLPLVERFSIHGFTFSGGMSLIWTLSRPMVASLTPTNLAA